MKTGAHGFRCNKFVHSIDFTVIQSIMWVIMRNGNNEFIHYEFIGIKP